MKRQLRNVCSFLLVCVLILSVFVGCTSMNARTDSISDVLEHVGAVKEYSATTEISLSIGTEKLTATLEETCDGTATVYKVYGTYGGVNISIKKAAVVTKDAIYINVGAIIGELYGALKLANIDLKPFLPENDWVVVKYEEKNDDSSDSSKADYVKKLMEDTYKPFETKEDGAFVLESNSKETLAALVKATKEMIENNKSDFAKEIASEWTKQRDKLTDGQLEELKQSMENYSAYLAMLGYEIDADCEGTLAELDDAMSEAKILETIESWVQKLESLESQIQEPNAQELSFKVTAKEDKSTYTFTLDVNANVLVEEEEKEVALSVKKTVLSADQETIEIPEDAVDWETYYESIQNISLDQSTDNFYQEYLDYFHQLQGNTGYEWLDDLDFSGILDQLTE